MKKTMLQDKYPVNTLEIKNSDIKCQSVDEILAFFKDKIENHPIATYISTFDNYTHTKSINGAISEDIKEAKIIIFCFGKAIPVPEMLAVRPRSIGISKLQDSFSITFMDAPVEELNVVMAKWVNDLKK
jgi:hypothetical protein